MAFSARLAPSPGHQTGSVHGVRRLADSWSPSHHVIAIAVDVVELGDVDAPGELSDLRQRRAFDVERSTACARAASHDEGLPCTVGAWMRSCSGLGYDSTAESRSGTATKCGPARSTVGESRYDDLVAQLRLWLGNSISSRSCPSAGFMCRCRFRRVAVQGPTTASSCSIGSTAHHRDRRDHRAHPDELIVSAPPS